MHTKQNTNVTTKTRTNNRPPKSSGLRSEQSAIAAPLRMRFRNSMRCNIPYRCAEMILPCGELHNYYSRLASFVRLCQSQVLNLWHNVASLMRRDEMLTLYLARINDFSRGALCRNTADTLSRLAYIFSAPSTEPEYKAIWIFSHICVDPRRTQLLCTLI